MSLLAPDIKKRNLAGGSIEDGTPKKQKVDLLTIQRSELRLPYIKEGGNFNNKKKSVAGPPKKDFFKLVTPNIVELEQND